MTYRFIDAALYFLFAAYPVRLAYSRCRSFLRRRASSGVSEPLGALGLSDIAIAPIKNNFDNYPLEIPAVNKPAVGIALGDTLYRHNVIAALFQGGKILLAKLQSVILAVKRLDSLLGITGGVNNIILHHL